MAEEKIYQYEACELTGSSEFIFPEFCGCVPNPDAGPFTDWLDMEAGTCFFDPRVCKYMAVVQSDFISPGGDDEVDDRLKIAISGGVNHLVEYYNKVPTLSSMNDVEGVLTNEIGYVQLPISVGYTSEEEGHNHIFVINSSGSGWAWTAFHPDEPAINHNHGIQQFNFEEKQSECYPDCSASYGIEGVGPHNHDFQYDELGSRMYATFNTGDDTAAFLNEIATAEKYYVDTRPLVPMKVLVGVPSDIFDTLPENIEAEITPEDEAVLAAAGQSAGTWGEKVLEITPRELSNKLRRVSRVLKTYAKYEAAWAISEGGVVSSGLNLKDESRRLIEFKAAWYDFLEANDLHAQFAPTTIGFGGKLARDEKFQIIFGEDYEIVQVVWMGSDCDPKILKKGFKAFKNTSPVNWATTRGYLAQIADMDIDVTGREPTPWQEFITKYTYPEVTNKGESTKIADGDLSLASCIAGNIFGEGDPKEFVKNVVMQQLMTTSDLLVQQYGQVLCKSAKQLREEERRRAGRPPTNTQNEDEPGEVDTTQMSAPNTEGSTTTSSEASNSSWAQQNIQTEITGTAVGGFSGEVEYTDPETGETVTLTTEQYAAVLQQQMDPTGEAGTLQSWRNAAEAGLQAQVASTPSQLGGNQEIANFLSAITELESTISNVLDFPILGEMQHLRKATKAKGLRQTFQGFFEPLGACGFAAMIQMSLGCFMDGLGYDDMLKKIVPAAINAMSDEVIGYLFKNLPKEVQDKIKAEVLKTWAGAAGEQSGGDDFDINGYFDEALNQTLEAQAVYDEWYSGIMEARQNPEIYELEFKSHVVALEGHFAPAVTMQDEETAAAEARGFDPGPDYVPVREKFYELLVSWIEENGEESVNEDYRPGTTSYNEIADPNESEMGLMSGGFYKLVPGCTDLAYTVIISDNPAEALLANDVDMEIFLDYKYPVMDFNEWLNWEGNPDGETYRQAITAAGNAVEWYAFPGSETAASTVTAAVVWEDAGIPGGEVAGFVYPRHSTLARALPVNEYIANGPEWFADVTHEGGGLLLGGAESVDSMAGGGIVTQKPMDNIGSQFTLSDGQTTETFQFTHSLYTMLANFGGQVSMAWLPIVKKDGGVITKGSIQLPDGAPRMAGTGNKNVSGTPTEDYWVGGTALGGVEATDDWIFDTAETLLAWGTHAAEIYHNEMQGLDAIGEIADPGTGEDLAWAMNWAVSYFGMGDYITDIMKGVFFPIEQSEAEQSWGLQRIGVIEWTASQYRDEGYESAAEAWEDRHNGYTPWLPSAYHIIVWIQKLLIKHGFGDGLGTSGLDNDGCDGDFGTKTDTAVKAFQASRGLAEDGIVGWNTWYELTLDDRGGASADSEVGDMIIVPPPSAFEEASETAEASSGYVVSSYVKLLQQELAERGYLVGESGNEEAVIDGKFGPVTSQAVKDFQDDTIVYGSNETTETTTETTAEAGQEGTGGGEGEGGTTTTTETTRGNAITAAQAFPDEYGIFAPMTYILLLMLDGAEFATTFGGASRMNMTPTGQRIIDAEVMTTESDADDVVLYDTETGEESRLPIAIQCFWDKEDQINEIVKAVEASMLDITVTSETTTGAFAVWENFRIELPSPYQLPEEYNEAMDFAMWTSFCGVLPDGVENLSDRSGMAEWKAYPWRAIQANNITWTEGEQYVLPEPPSPLGVEFTQGDIFHIFNSEGEELTAVNVRSWGRPGDTGLEAKYWDIIQNFVVSQNSLWSGWVAEEKEYNRIVFAHNSVGNEYAVTLTDEVGFFSSESSTGAYGTDTVDGYPDPFQMGMSFDGEAMFDILIDYFKQAILTIYADAMEDLFDAIEGLPGAELLGRVIAMLDCPKPVFLDPPLDEWFKGLDLNPCRGLDDITLPEKVFELFPFKLQFMNMKGVLVEILKRVFFATLTAIVMKIIEKVLKLLIGGACNAMKSLGKLAAAGMKYGVDGMYDQLREIAGCPADTSDEEVAQAVEQIMTSAGITADPTVEDLEAAEGSTEALISTFATCLTNDEFGDLLNGRANENVETMLKNVIPVAAPAFASSLNSEVAIRNLFMGMGRMMDLDTYNQRREETPTAAALPVKPQLCPESRREEFDRLREMALREKDPDMTDEQIEEQLDLVNSYEDDTAEEIVELMQSGVGEYIADQMPPIVSEGGCGTSGLFPSSLTANEAAMMGAAGAFDDPHGSIIEPTILQFYEDIMGNNGIMNCILSDKAGQKFRFHNNLYRLFTGRYGLLPIPAGSYPQTVGLYQREQMLTQDYPFSVLVTSSVDASIGSANSGGQITDRAMFIYDSPSGQMETTGYGGVLNCGYQYTITANTIREPDAVLYYTNKDGVFDDEPYEMVFNYWDHGSGSTNNSYRFEIVSVAENEVDIEIGFEVDDPLSEQLQTAIDNLSEGELDLSSGRSQQAEAFATLAMNGIREKFGNETSDGDYAALHELFASKIYNTINSKMLKGLAYEVARPTAGPNETINTSLAPAYHWGDYLEGSNEQYPILPINQSSGLVGLAGKLIPPWDVHCGETAASTPIIDWDGLASEMNTLQSTLKMDQRLSKDPSCVHDPPFRRVHSQVARAGTEGMIRALIKVTIVDMLIKGNASFSTFDASMHGDMLLSYIVEKVVESVKIDSAIARMGVFGIDIPAVYPNRYYYEFLEQSVRVCRRMIREGLIEDNETYQAANDRIKDITRRWKAEKIQSQMGFDPWKFTYRATWELWTAKAESDALTMLRGVVKYELDQTLKTVYQTLGSPKYNSLNTLITGQDGNSNWFPTMNVPAGATFDPDDRFGSFLQTDTAFNNISIEGARSIDANPRTTDRFADGWFILEKYIRITDLNDEYYYSDGTSTVRTSDDGVGEAIPDENIPTGVQDPSIRGSAEDYTYRHIVNLDNWKEFIDNNFTDDPEEEPEKLGGMISTHFTSWHWGLRISYVPGLATHEDWDDPSEEHDLFHNVFNNTAGDVAFGETKAYTVKGYLSEDRGMGQKTAPGSSTKPYIPICPLVSVELQIEDGNILDFNPNNYNLACMVDLLTKTDEYNLLFGYCFPLDKLLGLATIYNVETFLPSIGQFEFGAQESWLLFPSIVNPASYGESASDFARAKNPSSDSEEAAVSENSSGNEPWGGVDAVNGQIISAINSAFGGTDGPGGLVGFRRWDQESFQATKRTIKKSFQEYYHSNDSTYEKERENNEGGGIRGKMRDFLQPARLDREGDPWWKKKRRRKKAAYGDPTVFCEED